jgi:hypothetical protein
MRKECDIRDKMLMTAQARKGSSRKRRPLKLIYPSHGVIMLQ